MTPVLGVIAVVLRGDQVLLVQRGKAPDRGLWAYPGGAVNWGEPVARAALRELREETGVICAVGLATGCFARRFAHEQGCGAGAETGPETGMSSARIGLALGAGGARGWGHIGVLRALDELGVTPDLVAGCSMGALVGAAWAADRLDALEDWVRALTPGKYLGLMDIRPLSGGLVEASEIAALLEELGVPDRIEDLPRPFAAVATDMETGREIWLREGPTHASVRASVGIPGVMSPVRLGGRWLLDGGLVNPIPVSVARAMGAEMLIAVNPNAKPCGRIWRAPEPEPTAQAWAASKLPTEWHGALGLDPEERQDARKPNYFEVLNAALDIMTEQIRRARLAGEPPHVLINMAFDDLTVLELHRGAEAIAEGHARTLAQSDLIRDLCHRRRA